MPLERWLFTDCCAVSSSSEPSLSPPSLSLSPPSLSPPSPVPPPGALVQVSADSVFSVLLLSDEEGEPEGVDSAVTLCGGTAGGVFVVALVVLSAFSPSPSFDSSGTAGRELSEELGSTVASVSAGSSGGVVRGSADGSSSGGST
ncbi:MAG TPA: hypothetical protein H9932_10170, partial [Candidatus Brachybacterium intestinipullorum]|nr:hypothetical protein [Candidatus Brachybacterium intestinipullorum]